MLYGCLGAGAGNDRFHIHDPGKAAGFSICQQVRVFRRFFALMPGGVADLQAPKPFQPHIAFPAGNNQSQGIALFGPKGLAVHLKCDQAIVERLFQWYGA